MRKVYSYTLKAWVVWNENAVYVLRDKEEIPTEVRENRCDKCGSREPEKVIEGEQVRFPDGRVITTYKLRCEICKDK